MEYVFLLFTFRKVILLVELSRTKVIDALSKYVLKTNAQSTLKLFSFLSYKINYGKSYKYKNTKERNIENRRYLSTLTIAVCITNCEQWNEERKKLWHTLRTENFQTMRVSFKNTALYRLQLNIFGLVDCVKVKREIESYRSS